MRAKSRNTFTTGEISKICSVAQRTAIKWFDEGIIDGYIIPGTKDRRIPFNSLLEFMKKNKMPFDLFYQVEKSDLIEYCWEYNQKKLGKNSNCKNCVIFDTKTLKCYKFINYLNPLKKSSDFSWEDCDYYKKYWEDKNSESEASIYCWEHFSKSEDTKRDCTTCIIFKTKCLKCFEFCANIPNPKHLCSVKCEDCSFYYVLEKYLQLEESLNLES